MLNLLFSDPAESSANLQGISGMLMQSFLIWVCSKALSDPKAHDVYKGQLKV